MSFFLTFLISIFRFFYENKNRAFVEKLILFEEKTGAKREHVRTFLF